MSVMENSCLVAASPASEPFLFLVLLAFCEKKNDAFCSVALNNLILVFTYFMLLFLLLFPTGKIRSLSVVWC